MQSKEDYIFKKYSMYFYSFFAVTGLLLYSLWYFLELNIFATIAAYVFFAFIPLSLFQITVLALKIFRGSLEEYLKIFLMVILNYVLLMLYIYGFNSQINTLKVSFINQNPAKMNVLRYRLGETDWKSVGPLIQGDKKTFKLAVKKRAWFYWGKNDRSNPTTEKAFQVEPGKAKNFKVIYTKEGRFKRVLNNRFR